MRHLDEVPIAHAAMLCAVAFLVALTLPDADLAFGIGHRSALTHSLLPALIPLFDRRWHALACGTAGGCGIHLAADSFPRAMTGFATVKLPLVGSLGVAGSYAWLAINAAAALAIAIVLLARLFPVRVARGLAMAGIVAGIGYLGAAGGGWWVLAAMAIGAAGWWRLRR